jgi:hypothetical protein
MTYERVYERFIGPAEATPQSSLEILVRSGLRFGDIGQIQALSLLRLAHTLIGVEYECDECGGRGYDDSAVGHCDRCGEECSHCSSKRYCCTYCKGEGKLKHQQDDVYRMTERIIRAKLGQPEELAEAA